MQSLKRFRLLQWLSERRRRTDARQDSAVAADAVVLTAARRDHYPRLYPSRLEPRIVLNGAPLVALDVGGAAGFDLGGASAGGADWVGSDAGAFTAEALGGETDAGPADTDSANGLDADSSAVEVAEGDGLTETDFTVYVGEGETLGGIGPVGGPVVVSAGGTLAPGHSPGTLEMEGLSLEAGATFDVDIEGPLPGVQYDQVIVSGTVDLGGATLNLLVSEFDVADGAEFLLIDNDGTDPVIGTFADLADGSVVSDDFAGSGKIARISYFAGDGNDVAIIVDQTIGVVDLLDNGSENSVEVVSVEGTIQVRVDGEVVAAWVGEGIEGLTINGVSGVNDTVTLDFNTYPELLAIGSFTIDLGGDINDRLVVIGDGSAMTIDYTAAGSGEISFGSAMIAFAGIGNNTLVVDGTDDLTLNFGDTADNILFADHATAGVSQVSGDNFVSTQFGNPADRLTINLGNGGQAVTFSGLDAAFNPSLGVAIFGGSGDDTVVIDSLGNGFDRNLQVDTGDGTDSVTFGGSVTVEDLAIASASIGQSAAITVNGLSSFDAGDGTLVLDAVGNSFAGAVTLSNSHADGATLRAAGQVNLGASTIAGGPLVVRATELQVIGAVTAIGGILDGGTGQMRNSAAGTIDFGSADAEIVGDSVTFAASITGTAELTIRPTTDDIDMGLGFDAPNNGDTFRLGQIGLNNLSNSFSSVTIGNLTSGTGFLTIDNATFSAANLGGTLTIVAGSISVSNLSVDGSLSLIARTGTIIDGGSGLVGGDVSLRAAGVIGSPGNGLSLDVDTLTTDTTVANSDQFLALDGSVTPAASGLNAGSGSITLLGGTLLITPTSNVLSELIVENTATLTGSGTIAAPVTVAAGGTLSPGDGVGVLTLENLTLDTGAEVQIDLNGTLVGIDYDQLDVIGSVLLSQASLQINLGFMPTIGDSFTLIANDGVDPVSGTFAGLVEGQIFDVLNGVNFGVFQISYQGGDGNDVVVTAIDPGELTFSGTAGADEFLIVRDDDNVLIYRDNVLLASRTLATITGGITISGGGGDDLLIIDVSGGNPIPTSGIVFDGGAGDDSLQVIDAGEVFDAHTYQFIDATRGELTLTENGDDFVIDWVDVTSIENDGTPSAIEFLLPENLNSNVVLADDAQSQWMRLTGDTITTVRFAIPSRELTLRGGVLDDSITVASVDQDYRASLTIDGGVGTDTITLATDLQLGSAPSDGNLSLTAETIAIGPGTITLRTDGNSQAGDVLFAGAVSIVEGASLEVITDSDSDGTIEFQESVSGTAGGVAENLTLNAGSGAITFAGEISNIGLLEIVDSGGTVFGGSVDVTTVSLLNTVGTISFADRLDASDFLSGTSGLSIEFDADVTIANAVLFENTGGVVFGNGDGDVLNFLGGVVSTTSTSTLAGQVFTAGNAATFGVVSLDADSRIDTGAGDILITGAINGAHALELAAGSGQIELQAAVGNSTALTSLTVSSASLATFSADVTSVGVQHFTATTIEVDGDHQTAGGDIRIDGDLILLSATTLNTSGGQIIAAGTINGPHALTLAAGIGEIDLQGIVGAADPLAALVVDSALLVRFAADVTTVGVQDITAGTVETNGTQRTDAANITIAGDLVLGAATTFDTGMDGGNVSVLGTVDGNQTLTIAAGVGDVELQGDVGGTEGVASLLISAADRVDFGGDVTTVAAQSVTATQIGINGAHQTDGGNITLAGDVFLGSASSWDSGPAGGDITVTGTVNGIQSLAVSAGTGTVHFQDAVGNSDPLTSLVIDSAAIAIFDAAVTTSGIQQVTASEIRLAGSHQTSGSDVTFTGNVTLTVAALINTGLGAGDVTVTGAIDGAAALTILAGSGEVGLQGPIGNGSPLDTLTVESATSLRFGGDVTTFGEQDLTATTIFTSGTHRTSDSALTFDGDLVLEADTLLITGVGPGDLTVSGTINGGFGLRIDAGTGAVDLLDTIGDQVALAWLEVVNATTLRFGSDVVTTGYQSLSANLIQTNGSHETSGGQIVVSGAVELQAATRFDSGGGAGDIELSGSIDGDHSLEVNAGSGQIVFWEAIGVTSIASLSVTSASEVLFLADVTSSGSQQIVADMIRTGVTHRTADSQIVFDGDVELFASTALLTGSGSGDLVVTGAVSGNSHELVTVTGGGSITFQGPITDLTSLTLQEDAGSSTGSVSFLGDVDIDSLVTFSHGYQISFTGSQTTIKNNVEFRNTAGVVLGDGGDQFDFVGGIVSTASETLLHATVNTLGSDAHFGVLRLAGDSVIDTADGDLQIAGTLDGGHNLTIVADAGEVTFAGDVGGIDALASFDVTAASIVLAAAEYRIADPSGDRSLTFNGQVLLSNDVTLAADGNVVVSGPVDADFDPRSLTIEAGGNVLLAGPIGANAMPQSLSITADGDVTTAGTITLADTLQVDADNVWLIAAVSTDGAIEITSDNQLRISGNVDAGSSLITLRANQTGVDDEGFLQDGGAIRTTNLDADSVEILVGGGGDASLVLIETAGGVRIVAGGAITGTGGGTATLTAAEATLLAGSGIEVTTSAGNIDAEVTDVGDLTVTLSGVAFVDANRLITHDGQIDFVSTAGSLNVGEVTAGGDQAVYLTADAGSITGLPLSLVTADRLFVSALGTITLDTAINELTAQSTAGSLSIDNQGLLTAVQIFAGGDVSLTADSIIATSIVAADTVELTAASGGVNGGGGLVDVRSHELILHSVAGVSLTTDVTFVSSANVVQGDLVISDIDTLYVANLTVDQGNIGIEAADSLVVIGPATASDGQILFESTGGDLRFVNLSNDTMSIYSGGTDALIEGRAAGDVSILGNGFVLFETPTSQYFNIRPQITVEPVGVKNIQNVQVNIDGMTRLLVSFGMPEVHGEFFYHLQVDWGDGPAENFTMAPSRFLDGDPNQVPEVRDLRRASLSDGNLLRFLLDHQYSGNPDPTNASAPIPVSIVASNIAANGQPANVLFFADGNLTTPLTSNVELLLNVAAGLAFAPVRFESGSKRQVITEAEERTIEEPPSRVTVDSSRATQVVMATVETPNVYERYYVLRIVVQVDEFGNTRELADIRIDDEYLRNLPALFELLPDDRYRLYLIREDGVAQMVTDVIIRGGRSAETVDDWADDDRPAEPAEPRPEQDSGAWFRFDRGSHFLTKSGHRFGSPPADDYDRRDDASAAGDRTDSGTSATATVDQPLTVAQELRLARRGR